MAAKEITVDDAAALLSSMDRPASNGKRRTITRNKSNGLFVSDPSFRCYSVKKDKPYQGSFNLDEAVAKALFDENSAEAAQLRHAIAVEMGVAKK